MGIKSRRSSERQARADAIKHSAWKIFLRDGFDSAKLADIADDCELGLSTLYYYFRDKRQIVYSLMLDFKSDINSELIRLIEDHVTYEEFTRRYIDVHLRDTARFAFFVFADSFYNYHSQYDLADPVLDEYNRITSQNGRYIVSCLSQGRGSETEARVRVAIRMILGSLRRYVLLPQESWPSNPGETLEMRDALTRLGASLFASIGFDVNSPIPLSEQSIESVQ